MHKVVRSLKSTKLNKWHLIGVVVIVFVVLMIGPLKKLFDGLSGSIKTLFAGVNGGMSQLNEWLGLDKKQSDEVDSAMSPGPNDPWSPNYYKRGPAGTKLFTVAKCEQLIEQIKDGCNWWDGVNMGILTGVFEQFENKCQFSFFCSIWLEREGSALQRWLCDGWLGGLISSVGDSDFLDLKAIVDQLPEFST